jgi:hypothetical protein
MKKFNEWLVEKDPEFLEESLKDWAKAGVLGLATMGGGLMNHQPAQAAPSVKHAYQVEYSSTKFDVSHAVETLGLSSVFLAKPEKVYDLMISKWKGGKLTDSQFSKLFDKYKEKDAATGKWYCNPPACC